MTSKDITLLASKVCVWHEICLTVSSYLWIDRLKTLWQQHYDKCDMEEREKLKKNHPNDVINGWPRTFREIWDLNKHWNLLNLNLMRKTYFRWNRFFVVKLVLKHFRKKNIFPVFFSDKKIRKKTTTEIFVFLCNVQMKFSEKKDFIFLPSQIFTFASTTRIQMW